MDGRQKRHRRLVPAAIFRFQKLPQPAIPCGGLHVPRMQKEILPLISIYIYESTAEQHKKHKKCSVTATGGFRGEKPYFFEVNIFPVSCRSQCFSRYTRVLLCSYGLDLRIMYLPGIFYCIIKLGQPAARYLYVLLDNR